MKRVLASIAGLLAHQVASHGGCLNYTVGETWYPGYVDFTPPDIPSHDLLSHSSTQLTQHSYNPDDDHTSQEAAPWMPQRSWITVDPIFETTNHSLSCNFPGRPARAYIPITAGSNITAVYGSWVHTVGPMIAWMAHCPGDDCFTADPSTLDWFKIGQKGLESGTIELGDWFQKTFSRWDGTPSLWSETVPKGLRKGRYLVRHEIISLHSANKPQFYPECANLDVSGEGEGYPEKKYMAKFPGVWSMNREFSC